MDYWGSDCYGGAAMNGLKISFAVVAFVLVQGIGVIWYVSKLDSRVDQMYKSFEEENKKEVIENQVKMKIGSGKFNCKEVNQSKQKDDKTRCNQERQRNSKTKQAL